MIDFVNLISLKFVKMADFALLESQKLISRKIWVIEKGWNFHHVFGKSKLPHFWGIFAQIFIFDIFQFWTLLCVKRPTIGGLSSFTFFRHHCSFVKSRLWTWKSSLYLYTKAIRGNFEYHYLLEKCQCAFLINLVACE